MEEENSETISDAEEEKKCMQVDSYMLPAKVTCFFTSGKASLQDYMMLFYTSTGLSPSEAGFINGVQYIGGAVGNPFWSYIADNKGHHKTILLFLCFMAVVTIYAKLIISMILSPQSNFCPRNHTLNEPTIVIPEKSHLFYSLLFTAILASSFNSTADSFADVGILLRVRSSPGGRANIGMQKYAGSLGSFAASFVYSVSVQYFPPGASNCYTGIFVTYFLFNLGFSVSSHFLYKNVVILKKEKRINIHSILWTYIKRFDSLLFFSSVLLNGILYGTYFSFLFLYLKSLHAPTLLLGASIGLNCISALTAYIFSERIIHALGGSCNAMCFSTSMWGFRFLCTAAMTNPYLIFIIDLFHGFTFSLFQVSSLKFVGETADERICTTVCGIAAALFRCCSFVIANIVGGVVFEKYGPKVLFNGAAVLSFSWTLVIVVCILVSKRPTQEYSKLKDCENENNGDDDDDDVEAT